MSLHCVFKEIFFSFFRHFYHTLSKSIRLFFFCFPFWRDGEENVCDIIFFFLLSSFWEFLTISLKSFFCGSCFFKVIFLVLVIICLLVQWTWWKKTTRYFKIFALRRLEHLFKWGWERDKTPRVSVVFIAFQNIVNILIFFRDTETWWFHTGS